METFPMIKPMFYSMIVLGVLSAAVRADQDSGSLGNPQVEGVVKVAQEIKLPGKEAGVLTHLSVQEGEQVRAGQVIGQIDPKEAELQKKSAEAAYRSAYEKWLDDIEHRYAKAQAAVAKATYELNLESNRLSKGAVTQVELNEKKLELDRAELGIEKALHDKKLANLDAMTKRAELEAAELGLHRRVVTAPFDGIVEEIKRHQEEWVQPGDAILTLLRMDTMHVEGAIEQNKYDPHEVQGCDVNVEVELARGRKATFRGRIIRVSSSVGGDDVYNVRAEIANQLEQGNWLLRDGMRAVMTIQLGTGRAAPAVSRAK
jgi:multidrug resistance efflux pump